MWTSYSKLALRSLWRDRGYAALNVLGLAVGLAMCFFILLWVGDEVGHDRFHEQGERIQRVFHNVPASGGQLQTWTSAPYPMSEAAVREIPGVERAVPLYQGARELLVTRGGTSQNEASLMAGSAFFDVFSFLLLVGDPTQVLDDPQSAVLSASLARRLFGADWRTEALGQTFTVDQGREATVTGVFADVPTNSSLQFDLVLPIEPLATENRSLQNWGNFNTALYLLLDERTDPARVEAALDEVLHTYHEHSKATPMLQPFTEGYLYGTFENGTVVGGRIEYVRLFLGVALFVLLIAAINFMNLATARSAGRAREIGMRKVVGAGRWALAGQFLSEAVLTALAALVAAAGLVGVLLPSFNTLVAKNLAVDLSRPLVWGVALGVALGTGLLAGSYPAMHLSALQPSRILRGQGRQHTGAPRLRRALVVGQFALSILLIVGTLAAYQQVQYVQTKNLGLDRENVISTELTAPMQAQFDGVAQEVTGQPGVLGLTRTNQDPLQIGNSTGDPTWPGRAPDDQTFFNVINVGYDFTETMRIDLAAGRAFSRVRSDSNAYLVNEAAARAMGVDEPLGMPLSFWDQEGPIVGVVEDFHFRSLREAIQPLIIRLDPETAGNLLVRARPGAAKAVLAELEAVHERFSPEVPFAYSFLDEEYEAMYRSEQVVSRLARYFALMALFISCLGLFGLASYSAAQRTKEIGVRKALGAPATSIVALLTREYAKLVAVAFALAAPLAYWLVGGWLGGFAYGITLSPLLFAGAGLCALTFASLTVSYHALRAAWADPVRSLRHE